MNAIRIVLADDHPMFLSGLEAALEAEGLDVVGLAGNGHETIELVARVQPDAVLLDFHMPGMDGASCIRELRRHHPKVKVVMLSGHDEPESVSECLAAGAICFVGKHTSPPDIARALRAIVAPTVHFRSRDTPRETPQVSARTPTFLTPRESEMLRLVATGMSNREIARQLWVTEQTVKFHLSNVYRKLDVANRTEASRIALTLGLADRKSVV